MNKKIAIVCGGSRGIGNNIVNKLLAESYKIYIFDRLPLKEKNKNIHLVNIELSNIDNVLYEIEKLYNKYNNIDLLVYNARAGDKLNFLEETVDNFDISLDVMVKTPFFIAQKIGKLKKENNQKNLTSIVNISSIASNVIGSEPAIYHMAKAAINNMTKYVAKHGGKYNIRANAIAPGFIVQDEYLDKFYSDNNINFRTMANNIHPLNTIGNSDDVADMVIFLSSDKSKFINGQIITIDGGLTIQDPWDLVYQGSKL